MNAVGEIQDSNESPPGMLWCKNLRGFQLTSLTVLFNEEPSDC